MFPRQPSASPAAPLWQQVVHAARQTGATEALVAGRLGLGQRQLQRRWRSQGHNSLETFLQAVRFRDAVHLRTILGSVKEAAVLAGYPSSAPFCREFARSQGISPGRFLRRYRESQPYWNDPEMRPVRLNMQAETRKFCSARCWQSR